MGSGQRKARRKLIAGIRVSADERIEEPKGFADWVDTWAGGYGVMEEVDAYPLEAGMYPPLLEYRRCGTRRGRPG